MKYDGKDYPMTGEVVDSCGSVHILPLPAFSSSVGSLLIQMRPGLRNGTENFSICAIR
jgi:hypothetical protein